MNKIDLNCDMGERETIQGLAQDIQIMSFVSSVNVSCGFHSGNPFIIEETIKSAIQSNLKIGAHPSYRDRENFGRKSMEVDHRTLRSQLKYQICAVKGMVESLGDRLHHVKAHGALYNDMARNEELSKLLVDLVKEIDENLRIYGMSGSILERICSEEGLNFSREAFADRRYENLKTLRSRKLEGSVLSSEEAVLDQVSNFLNGNVVLQSGERKRLKVDTICLHSDTKGALELTKSINVLIKSKEIRIA